MGFWIFMMISDLIVPFTMIGFGKYFIKEAPKEINEAFGIQIVFLVGSILPTEIALKNNFDKNGIRKK